MTNIVLLGGNGYIGRATTKEWMRLDPTAQFYVISRSGQSTLTGPRVHTLAADVTSVESVRALLPEQVDYIVDFVGRPESDASTFALVNDKPADIMLTLAREKQVKAMGFIGGKLGPKSFLEGKKRIADTLKSSGIRTEVVEPTVVYGGGRSDALAKMIPVFKFFGMFAENMKPVLVSDVAHELVSKLVR